MLLVMTSKYEKNPIIRVLGFFGGWGGGVQWGEYHNVVVYAQSYDAQVAA